MQILSVALKNFKTHRDRVFEFQPGTNAICGENGAGKTSILEAIAWTLFNYQGDYAKEDLIRNGSSSAQVAIAFVSSRDERTYEVQRCTQRGYTLYDPQLGNRLPYSRIQDEVLPWLRQHLGVSPGTDLARLFARTIGVPQGTLTADFLLPAEGRRTVFDAVLKVEEYKEAFKQTNALRRYAEAQVDAIKRDLARFDEELAPWEDLKTRSAHLSATITADEAALKELTQTLSQLGQQRQTLLAQKQQLERLQAEHQSVSTQQQGQKQLLQRLETDLQRAEAAVKTCESYQPAYEQYLAADQALQELAQLQRHRQALEAKQRRLEADQQKYAAEMARIQAKLDSFTQIEAELAQIHPQVERQANLEQGIATIQERLKAIADLRLQQASQQAQRDQLQQQQDRLQQTLDRLTQLQDSVAQISDREQERDRLQQQLSRIEAARQFEAELQRLTAASQNRHRDHQTVVDEALKKLASLQANAPLLATEIAADLEQAIAAGLELNQEMIDALQNILQDLSTQVDRPLLQKQLSQQRQTLEQLYRHRAEVAQYPALEKQHQQLTNQLQYCQQQLQEISQQLAPAPDLESQLQSQIQALQALDNPRGRQQWLQRALQEKTAVTAQQTRIANSQAPLTQQLAACAAELEPYADLNHRLEALQAARNQHQAGYAQYLQFQQQAQQAPQLRQEAATAHTDLATLNQQAETLQSRLQDQQTQHDPAALAQLETQYQDLRSRFDRLSGSLPEQRTRQQELQQQLQALEATAAQRDRRAQELKQRERVRRFINFARKTYKEAGPRITEQYVHSIAQEADRLFRELLNRPNLALTWTKDYEIRVQEGPDQRRFLNLSGGEQMCAALAVRLALLKVLADIDIAFFDEPTTNMDRARREILAEAIARIKSFRQIFVISHDDTFEKATENLVMVEREV